MGRLNGLAHRVSKLELGVPIVFGEPQPEVEAERTPEELVWCSWPRVLRCYLASLAGDIERTDAMTSILLLEHVVALAVTATVGLSDAGATTIAIAASVLHDAEHRLTWRLIFANGGRAWRLSSPERQEAATSLVGLDSIDGLTDHELVQAWAANGQRDPDRVQFLDPAALALLRATSGELSPDECSHADGHDQVPSRHVQIAFEQPCLASIRSAFLTVEG